jgi:hypothetical protein
MPIIRSAAIGKTSVTATSNPILFSYIASRMLKLLNWSASDRIANLVYDGQQAHGKVVKLLSVAFQPRAARRFRNDEEWLATLSHMGAGALVISTDPFFNSRNEQLAELTVRFAVPEIFSYPEFVAAGGLMSYGGSGTESYRLAGVYTGRILSGEKPAELPIQQSTKVELFINLKTAKALGMTFPLTLLGRADEVFE